jgi:hypothetical protein
MAISLKLFPPMSKMIAPLYQSALLNVVFTSEKLSQLASTTAFFQFRKGPSDSGCSLMNARARPQWLIFTDQRPPTELILPQWESKRQFFLSRNGRINVRRGDEHGAFSSDDFT